MNEGTNGSKESLQLEAEGSTMPELENSNSFERSVTSRPTLFPRLPHFTITGGELSKRQPIFHVASDKKVVKLSFPRTRRGAGVIMKEIITLGICENCFIHLKRV